jgi:hypothetical protein
MAKSDGHLQQLVPGRFDVRVFFNKTKDKFVVEVSKDGCDKQQFIWASHMELDDDGRPFTKTFGEVFKSKAEDRIEVGVTY